MVAGAATARGAALAEVVASLGEVAVVASTATTWATTADAGCMS